MAKLKKENKLINEELSRIKEENNNLKEQTKRLNLRTISNNKLVEKKSKKNILKRN